MNCGKMLLNKFNKGWGLSHVPVENRIGPNKEYLCDGRRVFALEIVLYSAVGNEVTYPVKGSVDMGKGKPPKYRIWTLDGQHRLGSFDKRFNLVENLK